jgi:hypothetical protein
MELKDQVCSLELAQKLKELGVKQNSLFKYVFSYSENFSFKPKIYYNICYNNGGTVSAFTVAELGVMMPSIITRNKSIAREFANKNVYIYEVQYSDINQSTISSEATEADARAKMLIYLLENNYIKVEDINE